MYGDEGENYGSDLDGVNVVDGGDDVDGDVAERSTSTCTCLAPPHPSIGPTGLLSPSSLPAQHLAYYTKNNYSPYNYLEQLRLQQVFVTPIDHWRLCGGGPG